MPLSLSFFDLSPEIRDNIYGFVFPVGEHIHAVPIYEPFEYWIFYICAAGNIHNRSSICSVIKLESQFLDFSLLCASSRVRRECLQFVLSRNNIMLHQFDIGNFFNTFSPYTYKLRALSLCLKVESHDGTDWACDHAATIVERARNLQFLALFIERIAPVEIDYALWDKHSDFFHQLQRLPLKNAKIFASENSPDADKFVQLAREFLLRDSETSETVVHPACAQSHVERKIDRGKQQLYASRGVVVVGSKTIECIS